MFSKIKEAIGGAREELDTVRQKISARKAERTSTTNAPMTKDESLGQLDQLIAAAAARYDRDIAPGYLTRPCSNLDLAFEVAERANSAVSKRAWENPGAEKERLTRVLHKFWEQNPPGLPSPERRQRIAALDAEILELERAEEAMIVAAAEHGIDLERRGDADPRAVIGTAE